MKLKLKLKLKFNLPPQRFSALEIIKLKEPCIHIEPIRKVLPRQNIIKHRWL